MENSFTFSKSVIGKHSQSIIHNIATLLERVLERQVKTGIVAHLKSIGGVGGTIKNRVTAGSPEHEEDIWKEAYLLGDAIESMDFSKLFSVALKSQGPYFYIKIDIDSIIDVDENELNQISGEITARKSSHTKYTNYPSMWRHYLEEGDLSIQTNYKFVPKPVRTSMYGIGIMIKTKMRSYRINITGKDLFDFYLHKYVIDSDNFTDEIKKIVTRSGIVIDAVHDYVSRSLFGT